LNQFWRALLTEWCYKNDLSTKRKERSGTNISNKEKKRKIE